MVTSSMLDDVTPRLGSVRASCDMEVESRKKALVLDDVALVRDDVALAEGDVALLEGDVAGANPRPRRVHMWGCWDGVWMRMKVSSD